MDDRLALVFELWDQIHFDGWTPGLNDEMKEELVRRVANFETSPKKVVTWEKVLEKVGMNRRRYLTLLNSD